MTDIPPPLAYASPGPEPEDAPQQSPVAALFCWCIIICCVAFVMYRVSRAYKLAAQKGIENPSSELQIQFLGKAAVGFKVLVPAPTTSTTTMPTSQPVPPANAQQFITDMDKDAKTPKEKVRVAIAVGELLGGDAALKRINDLDKSDPPEETKKDLEVLRTIYQSSGAVADSEAKQRLIDRHAFFGRLASAYNLPANDPDRTRVLADAKTSAILLTVMGIIVLLLLVVILVAVITAIVLAALGVFKRVYQRQPWANSAYLEAFAIWLLGFILVSRLFARLKLESLAWEWILILFIPLSMWWIRRRGVPADQARIGLGWYWGRGPHIEIPLGIFGYLAGIPVIVAGFVISMQLIKHAGTSPMHPIQQMLQGDKWHVLNLYGIACVFAPILEETMFRGALFNHMRRRWGWLISAGVVAFIFAAIHPQGWTLIPALGSIAIVLAALREWRGSLWAPVTAHAMNNFLVLSLALMAAR